MENIRKILCFALALLILQPILPVKGLSTQVVGPATPTVVLSRSGETTLTLHWDEIYGAVGYEVYSSANGVDYTLRSTQSALMYSQGSLTEGTKYYYRVRSYSLDGTTKIYSQFGETSMKFGDTLNLASTSDPSSLEYITTYSGFDIAHTVNFVDGLLESDPQGRVVPSLASEVTHNTNYTVWTFKLRQGVQWVTNAGTVYAEVTAQDFVSGLQHAVDFQSLMLYTVFDSIYNLDEYANGVITDFSLVGVKAIDKYTVQYTLNQPEPWFHTMTNQPVLLPVNKAFLESKGVGCKLGAPDSTTCEFGTLSPDSILYNGAFILTKFVPKSIIEYSKNENYWDKSNVFISQVNFIYDDTYDYSSRYEKFVKGKYSRVDVDKIYDEVVASNADNIVFSQANGVVFNIHFNLARVAVTNTSKTASQIEDTKKALLNKNFRLALLFGIDRIEIDTQSTGSMEVSKGKLRNTLVPTQGYVVNGKEYGTLVEEELKNLDSTAFANINLDDGQDAYFNPTLAASFLAKAKIELGSSVSWPIHLDTVANESSLVNKASANALKSSIENSVGTNNVIVDIWPLSMQDYFDNSVYARSAADVDYDISPTVGWGPDFDDPIAWHRIFDIDGSGDMLKLNGIENYNIRTPEVEEAILSSGLGEYNDLIDAANAEITDMTKRYQLFAKAEALLISKAIFIPRLTQARLPQLTRVVPYSSPYAIVGNERNKFKYTQVQYDPVTVIQEQAAKETWNAIRSNTGIYTPASFKATSSSYNSVKLSWDKVAAATGYEIYRGFNETGSFAKVATVSGTTLNYINTGLTTNRSYFYKIRAYSTVDGVTTYSNFSSVVSAKPIPAAPTSIDVVPVSSSSMQISWAAVEGATGYQLFRSFGPTGTFTLAASTATNSYLNTGLTLNRTYFYRVRAYTMVGTTRVVGPYSTIDSAKPIPAAAINILASSGGYDRINLSWSPAAGAGGYTIYRANSLTGSYSIVGNVTTNSFVHTGLAFNTSYYYKIRSYYMVGDVKNYGLMSEPVSAKTALSTPTVSSSNLTSTSIKLSWGAIAGANGYEVYRSTTSTGTYTLQSTVTTNTYSKTGLVKGMVYYYKVRAYRLVGSTKVYGNFSTPKYLKVGY